MGDDDQPPCRARYGARSTSVDGAIATVYPLEVLSAGVSARFNEGAATGRPFRIPCLDSSRQWSTDRCPDWPSRLEINLNARHPLAGS